MSKKLIDVRKAMKDLKKLLTETHNVKQVKDSYDYKGIDITHYKVLVTNPDIKESMTKKNLDWEREQHGTSMLDLILLKIFQLGYEQAQIEFDSNKEKDLDMTNLILKLQEKPQLIEKAPTMILRCPNDGAKVEYDDILDLFVCNECEWAGKYHETIKPYDK